MVKSIVAFYESQEKNGHNFRFFINLRRKLSSENFCRKRQVWHFSEPSEHQRAGSHEEDDSHSFSILCDFASSPFGSLRQDECNFFSRFLGLVPILKR